jgi:hypothetical protein
MLKSKFYLIITLYLVLIQQIIMEASTSQLIKTEPVESGEVFFVEKILDRRTRKCKTEYFVKWTGFPEQDNSWEPVGNLDCAKLIAEYEALNPKRKRGRPPGKKAKPQAAEGTPGPKRKRGRPAKANSK